MVFGGWFMKQRSDSLSEQLDNAQMRQMDEEQRERERRSLPASSVTDRDMNSIMIQEEQQTKEQMRPRRRSIFEMRGQFGADRFSREYADAMDDMWVAECDQGDAGRAGKGIMEGALFKRRVSLGQDEFSREYFDTMEDMFVAETDHGDSGFLYQNPHQPTFNRIPDGLRRMGQNLYRPVKVGSDEFSREYAREGEDFWLAHAGKGPSGRARPSEIVERMRLGSDGGMVR